MIPSGPSQIHVSYAGDQIFVISWFSLSPLDSSIVDYGTSQSMLSHTKTGTSTNYTYQGYSSGGLHTVALQNLEYSTTYYYKVGGPEAWSDVFSFKTTPAPGQSGNIFGVMADVGAGLDSEKTIKGLLWVNQKEGMDAVIHAGDLSYGDLYYPGGPVWDHYGDMLQPLASLIPYQPGVGNHEDSVNNFTSFRLRYSLDSLIVPSKGGEFYWSTDIGLVHLIHLSSENIESDSRPFARQTEWLEADLAHVNRKVTPWIIAIWHRPWYSSNKDHQGEGNMMRLAMEDLFNQYEVDLGITGHVHAYERIAPIYNFTISQGKTEYLVVGNGGSPEGLSLDWTIAPEWSITRLSSWGFGRLKVVNGTHMNWMNWKNSDGSVIDDYWFVRNRK